MMGGMAVSHSAGRRHQGRPGEHVVSRGQWPDGPFQRNSPPYVLAIAALAKNLRKVMEVRDMSLRETSRQTGVNPATLSMLLNGTLIPDTATLAQLEHYLDIPLWGAGERCEKGDA